MALNPTTALETCLRLMLRATPHPDDRDLWHDTIRQASILLDQQNTAPCLQPTVPVQFFWRDTPLPTLDWPGEDEPPSWWGTDAAGRITKVYRSYKDYCDG